MKHRRWLSAFSAHFCAALLLEVAVLASLASTGLWLRGYRMAAVESSSMTPTFKIGDAVLTRRARLSQLHVGEIVSFASAENKTKIVSHRIVAQVPMTDLLVTKGDHLRQSDSPIHTSAVSAQVVGVIPYLGRFINLVRKPLGALCLVCLPLIMLALHEAYSLGTSKSTLQYRLHM